MKTAVMKGLSCLFHLKRFDQFGHHLTAVCAFEKRFFDGSEEGFHFRTHSLANVRNLGLPVTVMEYADEGLSRASFEVLFFAELDELRAGSL